jgi:hypothetical protein
MQFEFAGIANFFKHFILHEPIAFVAEVNCGYPIKNAGKRDSFVGLVQYPLFTVEVRRQTARTSEAVRFQN